MKKAGIQPINKEGESVIIENRETAIKFNFEEGERNGTYADLIKMVVTARKAQGLTIGEMKKNFALLDHLDKFVKAPEITVEKADMKFIQQLLPSIQWPLSHRDMIGFEEYLMSFNTE